MYHQPRMLIAGEWIGPRGGQGIEVVSPVTAEVLGIAPAATSADVAAALAAAGTGLADWRRRNGWERARILRDIARRMQERAEELALSLTLEIGRPLAQSRAEVQIAADQFVWFAGEAERLFGETIPSRQGGRLVTDHEPVGIVAAFAAWNFPINLLARKIAPALAAGCAIICRPSEQAPATATILVECCWEAGVPGDVVQLLIGRTVDIVPPLMRAPEVRKISLTGSTAVGKQLLAEAAATVKRCSMELGGHSPVVVCDDVDVAAVAGACAQAKFRNAGQVCIAPNRFYVHEDIADAFKAAFVDVARGLKLGDGRDPDTTMGPLSTRRQLDRIEGLVADTAATGARLLHGGGRPGNAGYFFEPTVFADVADDARLMHEEPFGPVAPINTFRRLDEAIERANATAYGLAGYVFTRSLARAHELGAGIRAGMIGVNTFAIAHAEAPFGGVGESGMGREGGRQAIHDYLDVKLTHMMGM